MVAAFSAYQARVGQTSLGAMLGLPDWVPRLPRPRLMLETRRIRRVLDGLIAAALAELKRKVEAESTYVGPAFAAEARAIHDGTAPERPIYGEASGAEARALIEDGIPVAPLPFLPTSKAN